MFSGTYTDDVTGDEIANRDDMVVLTLEDKATKETRAFHLARDTYDDFLNGDVTASDIFLAD